MSTAVFDVACSIPDRIAELNRFIKLAGEAESVKDEKTYNTLCRACCILLASHLEGFLKDLTKSLTADLNFNLKSFANMPTAMRRTFCEKIAFYEGVPAEEINTRVKQLQDFFSSNSIVIDMQAFTYKENKNKNPGADVIDAAIAKMGVPAVLHSIAGGKLENVFKNDKSTTYLIRREIRRFRSRLFDFPYKKLPAEYEFLYKEAKAAKASKVAPSLWHTYIEDIMSRRHNIVHGDTMNNDTTSQNLSDDIDKMEVLMHGIMFSTVGYIVNKP